MKRLTRIASVTIAALALAGSTIAPANATPATPSSYLSGNNGVCQATWQIAVGWVNGLNLGQRAALQKVVQGPWGLVSDTFGNI